MPIATATYQSMLDEIIQIASKYSLGAMLSGFNPDLVNLLLHNHLDKIKVASSYEETQKLINAAISSHLGVSMDISHFITAQTDREKLYELFAAWRLRLLAEVTI